MGILGNSLFFMADPAQEQITLFMPETLKKAENQKYDQYHPSHGINCSTGLGKRELGMYSEIQAPELFWFCED